MTESNASDLVGRAPGGRKLIAVVYADMVGYSRLIGLNDEETLERVRALRSTLIDPAIDEHGGRIVQTGGDSLLIIFDSIDGAVRCAVKVQQAIPSHDGDHPADQAIRFRVGINIGDVIADGTDFHGNAVNVAARLQAECPPGAICVTRAVRDHVHDRLKLVFEELGALDLKNIARPIEVYVLRIDRSAATVRLGNKRIVKSIRLRQQGATRSDREIAAAIDAGFGDRPAIAVLPFKNFSGSPDQAYIADGIADEVINELASTRLFPVIARNSTFAFRDRHIDMLRLGKRLGARYIVDGSFMRKGQQFRIIARLIDAATGVQVAVERFDQPLEDFVEFQEKIAEMIVGSIAPEVLRAERDRVLRKPRKNATSYEYFLRGLEAHYRYTKVGNAEAQRLFRKAIEIDSGNAQAHALLASAMIHAVQHAWHDDDEHNYTVADQLASRAVALDPRAPVAHFSLGSTSMFLGRIDRALAEMQEAVRINPSHAAAHAIMASLLCFVGRPKDALESVKRALRLSPYDPRLGLWLQALAQAHYFQGNYLDGVSAGQRALSLIPDNLIAQRFTVASLGQLGRTADAEPLVATLSRSVTPSIEAVRNSLVHLYRESQMIEHLLEGLRMAGLKQSADNSL